MSWLALVLCAQLAAPATRVQPVLAFPDKDLDDAGSYRGYQTRLFRDASGNTIQIYLDDRANRVVHLWADAENESLGFSARGAAGRPVGLRWGSPTALVTRSKTARTVEHALVANEASIHLGWFLLGSMRVERDFQHVNRQQAAFATGPAELPELTLLINALQSLEPGERQRHLELLHARDVQDLGARLRPRVTVHRSSSLDRAVVAQPAIDGLDTLFMEFRTDPKRVRLVSAGDSLSLHSLRGTSTPFSVRISTSGRALTPLGRGQIFNARFLAFLARSQVRAAGAEGGAEASALRARRLERQVRGLELLSSREKLMAGLPTYATYFGRDMLMTALMMQPVWRDDMSEFVIASALRKLSPQGQVSHEEALGGQAVRESASEYAALISESSRLARAGGRAAADSLVVRARGVLGNVRRTRENYHMIDAEFQFPIVVARWIGNSQLSAARKRAFLLDAGDSGEPRLDRLLRELALVARLTAPYANSPIATNLISFAPRDSGRWGSQSWRDSGVGYAGGRFAMDVNAIWVPHALEALGQILGALRAIGISPDSIARTRPEFGATTPLGRYARDAGALGRDVGTWRGASRHFLVRLAPSDVRERVSARLAAMTTDERTLWSARIPPMSEGADTLAFLALSLDAAGQPISVANSDVATRLFLGDDERPRRVPSAQSRAETLRDVRLVARSYPIGLLVDGVGPVVANDAYASPSVWRAFELDRYHSPRVVWGRENNLFLIGAMAKLADASGAGTARDPALASYRRELRDAIDRVSAAVEASGFRSELWSYEVRDGRPVPVRYGSGSDVQLWSTTDLVVQFERSRLPK